MPMATHQPVEPSARATSSMTFSAVMTSAPRPPSDSGSATLKSLASASSCTRSGGSCRPASISAARARMRGASARATSRGPPMARAVLVVMAATGARVTRALLFLQPHLFQRRGPGVRVDQVQRRLVHAGADPAGPPVLEDRREAYALVQGLLDLVQHGLALLAVCLE